MKITETVLTLEKNLQGRDFVVGDLHGHASLLQRRLAELDFDASVDRVICVGDLIDRGPESAASLALLDEPWFYSVLGNHELLMYSGFKEENNKHRMMWLQHGGEWIANTNPSQWPDWFEKIATLPLAIEVTGSDDKTYGIIHADFPRLDWSEITQLDEGELKQCIWGRDHFKSRSKHHVAGIDYLIHGHNVCEKELLLGNRYYIEAGAYLGNELIIKPI